MKFHKDLIGQKYIPGVIWLVLGLLLSLFWGDNQILEPIRKNSWKPVQADLTEVWIVEPGEARKNTENTHRFLHWKYHAADGRQYFGTETIPGSIPASDPFSVGRSIPILVNPEKPSESTLFCWNDLTLSARILRGIIFLAGFVLAGIGVFFLVRTPRKSVITIYDCRQESHGLFHYAVYPLICLTAFGILAALTCFLDYWFFGAAYLLIFLFPLLLVHLTKKKSPSLFRISCPNPNCFSLKFIRMRMKTLAENACPACNTPLGIPPRSPEKKWKRSEIPDPKSVPPAGSLPVLLLLGWILLIIPLAFSLYPPDAMGSEVIRNSARVLLLGWTMTGLMMMPFFMELSRRWTLRKKKALLCPLCGACLCERESIETLRQTGHCPFCGADLVESD